MASNFKPLQLSSARETEIANEFGGNGKFREGDTVMHNHKTGRYRPIVFADQVQVSLSIDRVSGLASLSSDASRAAEKEGKYGVAAYHARTAAMVWEACGDLKNAEAWSADVRRLLKLMEA